MSRNKLTIVIDNEGRIRHLLEDSCELIDRVSGSVDKIVRNSHVETWHSLAESAKQQLLDRNVVAGDTIVGHDLPLAKAWWADMQPVRGPVLGPFTTREDALEAELIWLRQKGLPCVNNDTA